MKLITGYVLLSLLLVSHANGQTKRTVGSATVTEFHKIIDPLALSNNYSGNVIVQKDGKDLFNKSFGLADKESNKPVTKKTRFFLASISAMFTAAATMKLVEMGKLSLDDKLARFLPDFPNGDKITIHHLLAERTGIPRIGSDGKVNYSSMTESAQTIDQLIGYFKDYKLEFEPGTKYGHSRSSYILLAKIIEKTSGMRFGEFLKKEVFGPLEMQDTGHFEISDKYNEIYNLAKGYVQSGVDGTASAQQIHWSSKTGHASIYSTTEDLRRFANAALKKKLLSPNSWQKVLTPHHGEGVGYGWFISPQGKHKRFHMSGGSPGFSTFVAVYPDDGLVIVMLSNIQIHVPYFTVPKLASVVFGEPYEKLNLVSPPDVDPALIAKYTGTYRFKNGFYNPRGIVEITGTGSRLFSGGGPLIPIDEGKGTITKFIHRRYWSTLEFVKDEKGQFLTLKFDDFTGQKDE